jgi:hypothetical protein
MPEHLLFLTGRLARPRLEKVLDSMRPTAFSYAVFELGVKVAALLTADLIRRRLPRPLEADKVVVPGRCRADLAALSAHFDRPFLRGPDDVKDLPAFFGGKGGTPDLSRYDVRIFAEIVEAPTLDLDAILARAAAYRRAGADVIDLGCLPDTPFPHLEAAVAALIGAGHRVSVDSADPEELRRGGRAGAHYLLSLSEETLWLADEVPSRPVVIPARHGDLDSLARAMAALDAKGRDYIVDPILDPIHFGFTDSLWRYAELRRRAGHRLGAQDRQRPGGAGEPALPPRGSGARRGPAHDVRGPRGRQPAGRLRSGVDVPARPQAVPEHPGGDRRDGADDPRSELPIRASASRLPRTGCIFTTARAITWRPTRSGCFPISPWTMTGRMPSTSGSRRHGRSSPGSSASATCRTSRSIGAAPWTGKKRT